MTTKMYEVTFRMEIDEDVKAQSTIDQLLANFDPHPGLVRTYQVEVKDLGRGRILPNLPSFHES